MEPASGNSHLLRPFQSSDLHVEPVEKSVIMPDSQQHVTARTICMQFEGNWSPVQDIIVDKVGKYAYTIGSHHDRSVTPVVMDVSLDIRTKVRFSALQELLHQKLCTFNANSNGNKALLHLEEEDMKAAEFLEKARACAVSLIGDCINIDLGAESAE